VDNIKNYKQKPSLTQDDLARRSGVKYTTLSKIESRAVTKPTVHIMAKITKVSGVVMEDLIKQNITMENTTNNEAHDFIKREVLKIDRNAFIFRILATVIGYAGITFWLNSIRATAPLWFVWVLIIIQFALYFSIFIASYRRAVTCGLNKNIGLIIFITLAILGRVNDWELLIIPFIVIIMLIVSARAKNVSDESKHLLPEK
jgi:transcriptional regulator with XRE-family HTH domain